MANPFEIHIPPVKDLSEVFLRGRISFEWNIPLDTFMWISGFYNVNVAERC